MKFGKEIDELMRPGWELKYVPYTSLKKLIGVLADTLEELKREPDSAALRAEAQRLRAEFDERVELVGGAGRRGPRRACRLTRGVRRRRCAR